MNFIFLISRDFLQTRPRQVMKRAKPALDEDDSEEDQPSFKKTKHHRNNPTHITRLSKGHPALKPPPEKPNWKVDDFVAVFFADDFWYLGTIIKLMVSLKKAKVFFFDDQTTESVSFTEIVGVSLKAIPRKTETGTVLKKIF